MKKSIMATILFALMAQPALASQALNTNQTYNSGILVLLFVGFCALLIVAQLVPAVLALFGMTKEAARNSKRVEAKSKV